MSNVSTATDFRQHRDEVEAYADDYSKRLGSAETLQGGSAAVSFWQPRGDTWVSQASEFAAAAPTINGTRVEYTVDPVDTIAEGVYTVRIQTDTSGSRTLIETRTIEIHADPD